MTNVIYHTIALAAGFLLDLIFGDPRWLYHPVCLIGKLISSFEKGIRKVFPKTEKGELAGGLVEVILICVITLLVPAFVLYFLYILFAILIFGILIMVHELGHFLTAKLFKVKVNEFSIFMGPAIWKRQRGETLYSLRCIPLGGYCAMEGEDENSEDPRAFGNATWWKRIIILAAGATMNFLTGFLVLVILVGFSAGFQVISQPVVDSVEAGSSLEGYLQPGDRLYRIDGERVYIANDFTTLLSLDLARDGNFHDVVVIRDGKQVTFPRLNVEARQLPSGDGMSLRYGINLVTEPRSLGNVLSYSAKSAVNYARTVRLSLQMIFRGELGLKEVTGPVGIVKTIADVGTQSRSVSVGIWNVLSLGAFIAINLGIMNLLPIPALDGGRIVGVLLTSGIEGVTKKKLNPKIEGYIHAGGMVLLLALMVLILFKDVIQIFV